jgi:hypothetical protein
LADGAKEQQLQAERIAGGEGTFFDYARIGDPGNVIGTAKGLFDQGKAAVNGDMNAGGQLTGTVLLMMLGGKSASGSKSPGSFTFADEANVVRGGMCQPKQFVMGTHPSGVTGFSAETGTMSVNELSKALPNNQVGVTTVGKIRAIGGDVIKTAGRSPNHSTVTGLNGEQASKLFSPTIKNPFKL